MGLHDDSPLDGLTVIFQDGLNCFDYGRQQWSESNLGAMAAQPKIAQIHVEIASQGITARIGTTCACVSLGNLKQKPKNRCNRHVCACR